MVDHKHTWHNKITLGDVSQIHICKTYLYAKTAYAIKWLFNPKCLYQEKDSREKFQRTMFNDGLYKENVFKLHCQS